MAAKGIRALADRRPVPEPHPDADARAEIEAARVLLEETSKTREIELLAVTFILTARKDGTNPLARKRKGRIEVSRRLAWPPGPGWVPVEESLLPLWVARANRDLLGSGADFALDAERVVYRIEKDDILSNRRQRDGKAKKTNSWLKKQKHNDYKNRVVVLIPWAVFGGESGAKSRHILLGCPGSKEDNDKEGPVELDKLTHELGHFLGLSHTHPAFSHEQLKRYGLELQQTSPRAGETPEEQRQRLEGVVREALLMARGPGDIEFARDYGDGPEPIDLGWWVARLFAEKVCQDVIEYSFQSYRPDQLMKLVSLDPRDDLPDHYVPRPGAEPDSFDVRVDDEVRGNVMSYWHCQDVVRQFTAGQIAHMQSRLRDGNRKELERRVVGTFPLGPFMPGVRVSADDLGPLKAPSRNVEDSRP